MTKKFLTVKDLAALLNLKDSWIYDRTTPNGPEVIPHVKFGRHVLGRGINSEAGSEAPEGSDDGDGTRASKSSTRGRGQEGTHVEAIRGITLGNVPDESWH